MQCCASCISDRGLRVQKIPIYSQQIGTCSYCNTENELLVDPSKLRDHFEMLISIYGHDEDGRTLVEWFKDDWGMFKHPKMDLANSKALLADILDDGDIVRKKFSPTDLGQSDRLNLWVELKNELMYENRFFPQTKMDENLLSELLSHLVIKPSEVSQKWYRARMQRSTESYAITEMGAPPKDKASQGRANPSGIPYLYLASTINTAISEIRPHTGEYTSVADFTILDNLDIIDLRDPRDTVSPLILYDEQAISNLRGNIEFLVHLGDELTRPVLPHAVAIDYIPSQYLCEFIKRCGYHGVIYRSSVGDGVNLALFDPDCANPGKVEQRRVSRVVVEVDN